MIVMESDEDYQKRSPAGYPQFRDIALRRRLTDMLKQNKFSIDGDYHVFEKTQKFPLLKIKTALIAHFCFKINGDQPAAKKKKVIPVVEEEDSEDEFLVTSFYTEPEVDIEDGNRLPDNEMDVEIQKEKPDQSLADADVIHQNVSLALCSIFIVFIQECSRIARKYANADYRRTCLKSNKKVLSSCQDA